MNDKRLIAYFEENDFHLDFEGRGNTEPREEKLYRDFTENKYETLFLFGFQDLDDHSTDSLKFLHDISLRLIDKITHKADIEFTREETDLSFTDDELKEILDNVPFLLGAKHLNNTWLENVFFQLSIEFSNIIKNYSGTVQEFLSEQKLGLTVRGRVFFHLVENKLDAMPFAFLATYSSSSDNKRVNHIPLKSALLEYKGQTEKLLELLSTVSRAMQKSELISDLVESGELFSPLKFSAEDAYCFLKEIPIYEEAGIICRIPDWWKRKYNRISLGVSIGKTGESRVGQNAILSFDTYIALGGEPLTTQEIEFLLQQTEGLVYLKGKWVEVDHKKLQQVLEMMETAESFADDGYIDFFAALRLEMDAAKQLGLPQDLIEVKHGDWLKKLLDRIKNPELIKSISPGDSFQAKLRPYQHIGLDWLHLMIKLGFGACLADDMGLGKTVQIIALLEHLRITTPLDKPSLLVLPASLLWNWKSELDRFAPLLAYEVLHGKGEYIIDPKVNLYITTYTMVTKLDVIKDVNWSILILDEAQAIKNPAAKQTKAVKSLKADSRIALTGTPIENHLSDLWSLFDFLNCGLLGTVREFKTLADQLRRSQDAFGKLRTAVSPFILRRLKTDKTIIDDLPDKIEIKAYTNLSKKQVVLYQKFVKDLEKRLEDSEGIDRKGLILGSLIKLKQICNHPDHFLGGTEYNATHSGKFSQLQEICETIYQNRERVLIFTQFKEIIDPLDQFLETIFERKGLVLHGSTQVKKRKELVERFSSDEYVPYMILSLKAGGVGLNLTKANHVIHFDRWWNPAVENQATDRAFRIGQTKNVIVHKFITSNTIEEKIDLMIEDKVKLAANIFDSSGENWITEMSDEELINMFRLAGDAL